MRLLLKVGLILIQVFIFIMITALSAKIYSYMSADKYLPGSTPSTRFPLVALVQGELQDNRKEYTFLRWQELSDFRRKQPKASFLLPEANGRISLVKRGNFETFAMFRIIENRDKWQVIEVIWVGDDYECLSRYGTDGSSIAPMYFRIWGISNMVMGIMPALIAVFVFRRLLYRKWAKNPHVKA